MVDTKQLSKEIRSLIKSASKADRDSIEEAIDESALTDNMKLKLHEELQVRLNESEQEVIDETVAAGKKDEARDLIDRKQEEINTEKDMKALPQVSAEVPKHKEIAVKTEEDMKKVQSGWEGKLVGYDPVAKIAKVLASVLILAVMLMPAAFAGMTDEAVLGNDRWAVDSSGNLEPVADGTLNLGASGNRVSTVYARSIDLTGSIATSTVIGDVESLTTSAGDPQGVATADIVSLVTTITSNAAGASADLVHLPNGSEGQVKILTLKTHNETSGVQVKPATFASTDVLLNVTGDTVSFVFAGGTWNLTALGKTATLE